MIPQTPTNKVVFHMTFWYKKSAPEVTAGDWQRVAGGLGALAFLVVCAGLAAPVLATPTVEEQDAIDQVNLRRQQIGLPALTHNSNLETSARGHASYLSVNNTTGHFQTSTLPG